MTVHDAPATSNFTPDLQRIATTLRQFQVMAVVVGVGLLVLVLEMVLKYVFHNDILAWWAMPHGFLYMAYLVTVLRLSMAVRMSLITTVGVMLAGCVPLLSFYVERRVAKTVRTQYELP